ncbi:MAG: hypothetical protein AAF330_01620 [Pseudomonadota bacterium]
MLTERAVDWWRLHGGEFKSFEHLQPFSMLLKWPTGDQDTPVPMLIGAETLHASNLGDLSPFSYRDRLAGPWREYGLTAMQKHRRVASTGEPEFGLSQFPGGLWGEPFHYEWITLPCRLKGASLIVNLSRRVTIN